MIIKYLVLINIITFIIFSLDKWFAKKRLRRVKNFTLIGLCIIGGSVGGLFAMYLFRHKTQTWYYVYGIPIIIITQIILLNYIKNI